MKPVRLPAAATIALPRWGIFALCLLYIVPGLIGRDPWKGDDAAGFGIMWTMAHGGINDWFWPHIVGLPMPDEGPLSFWIGAIFIKLFGWLLGDPMAARLSSAAFFLLGSLSVWYTTYLLGRRQEAQPLKLAFGGQPEPRDFGKTLADGALLIYIGCLGLLLWSHQTSAETIQVSLIAFTMYLAVRLLDEPSKIIATKLGIVLGLLVMTRGWVLPLGLMASLLLLASYRQQKSARLLLLLSAMTALAIISLWLVLLKVVRPFSSSPFDAWMVWNDLQYDWPSIASISYFFKYGIWFTWPAWPFAAWSVYAWRKQEKALHIALPLSFVACFTLLALANNNSEEAVLLPILPPLAILAAFGLPTMKRSTINAVDWFAVMVMTSVAGLFWFAWIAAQTGWPVRTSHKVLGWAPGFQAEFSLFAFVCALAATVAWFRLVYWRISRQPAVLWRAVVLSGGGVTLCWLLMMTLGLPLINHRITYSALAQNAAATLNTPYQCIDSNLGPAQRASFAYFGTLHFAGFSDANCDVLLLQTSRRHPKRNKVSPEDFPGNWKPIWQGHRAADKDELFTLYAHPLQ